MEPSSKRFQPHWERLRCWFVFFSLFSVMYMNLSASDHAVSSVSGIQTSELFSKQSQVFFFFPLSLSFSCPSLHCISDEAVEWTLQVGDLCFCSNCRCLKVKSWINLASGRRAHLSQLCVSVLLLNMKESNVGTKWVVWAFVVIMCFCAVEHGIECTLQVGDLHIFSNWGMCFCVLEHEGVEWMLQVMTL